MAAANEPTGDVGLSADAGEWDELAILICPHCECGTIVPRLGGCRVPILASWLGNDKGLSWLPVEVVNGNVCYDKRTAGRVWRLLASQPKK